MNMKKKIVYRCLLGAPIGVTISYLITIIISVIIGDGNYYPVVPALTETCGSEINAVLLQTACSFLYGMAWSGASVIWEKEQWSLLRMTVTHFLICCIATFPIAYTMQWMPHHFTGMMLYFGILFAVYLFIWILQYQAMKKQIEQINRNIQEKK